LTSNEARAPRAVTLLALQAALETAGIIFIDANGNGPGVRLGIGPERHRYWRVQTGAERSVQVRDGTDLNHFGNRAQMLAINCELRHR
jgi:hypothetical protein